MDVEVFFTRNGRLEGGWNLHEEVDAALEQPGGVTGLEGLHDLHAAIGVYGKCELGVRFGKNNCVYNLDG